MRETAAAAKSERGRLGEQRTVEERARGRSKHAKRKGTREAAAAKSERGRLGEQRTVEERA
jgi:hypothetical protein